MAGDDRRRGLREAGANAKVVPDSPTRVRIEAPAGKNLDSVFFSPDTPRQPRMAGRGKGDAEFAPTIYTDPTP